MVGFMICRECLKELYPEDQVPGDNIHQSCYDKIEGDEDPT